jgi:small subunit ribosomal protein S17
MAEENQEESTATAEATPEASSKAAATSAAKKTATRAHRSQKVGAVVSDKMQKTVVVRVDRLVRHTKYRRYVRRTSKFMAHDDLGATIGDKVRIVETRPMSARKRWRVIEIVQKAAK